MGIGTRLFRLGAVLPGIVLSAAMTLVVAAMLPATFGGMLLVAYVAAAGVLAFGRLEPITIRVLGRTRAATAGEAQLLQAVASRLHAHGVAVPVFAVGRRDLGRAAAEPWGRRTVVVAPRLLRWLAREQVAVEVAAAIVAQAAAGLRVGPSRFDLSVRWLLWPGSLVVAGFLRIAGLFTWVPGMLGLWRLRAVLGVVAVWQTLQDQQVTIAVTTGVLMAVSYTGPACARAWRRRVEAASDQVVASVGLGEELVFAVRSADEAGSVDRVHRVRTAMAETSQTAGPPNGRDRGLYLVR